jgi:putative transposase
MDVIKTWPHAPLHAFNETGTYIVTGSTLDKKHVFTSIEDLNFLHNLLLELAEKYQWRLEAWAIFSNHYHFVAQSPADPTNLKKFLTHFHATAARHINAKHNTPGRKVWFQFWDSRITFHTSYLARLNYVMQNPVRHKLVTCANQYKWCSASWFEDNADKAYITTVTRFKTDTINLIDDF